MGQLWRFPLLPQPNVAGTAVTAAALTSGLLGAPVPVLPGGIYGDGARLSIRATGEVTSTSATPTVVLDFRMGAVGSAVASETVVLAASSALAINVAATAWPFILEYDGTIRAVSTGVSANGVIHGQGKVFHGFGAAGGLAAAFVVLPFPITAALRTVSTLNTQINNQLDVGITLSSVTGTPSVTITDFWAELSN